MREPSSADLANLNIVAFRTCVRVAFKDRPELFPALSALSKPGVAVASASQTTLLSWCESPEAAQAIMTARDKFLISARRPAEFSEFTGITGAKLPPAVPVHQGGTFTTEPPTPPEAPPMTPVTVKDPSTAAEALRTFIESLAPQSSVDPEQVRAIVAEEIVKAKGLPRKVEIYQAGEFKGELPEVRHHLTEDLLTIVSTRQHAMLIGPAGSGKSHVCHQVADALGLPFYAISVGPQTTQAALMGYLAPDGRLVRTGFRDAFEHGGVLCLDEVDAGSAAVLTCINSALANGSCGFPDGMVKKHPDFILIGTANTYGQGKTMDYVGRNQLDGAFLNRFVRVPWPVDETLELALSPSEPWTRYVQHVRAVLGEKGVKAIVSPRQSIAGGKLLDAGMAIERVREIVLLTGLSPEATAIVTGLALPSLKKTKVA